jgi:hypothetical protein
MMKRKTKMIGKEIEYMGEEDEEISTPSGILILVATWEGKRRANEVPKPQCLNYTRCALSHLAYEIFDEILAIRNYHDEGNFKTVMDMEREYEKYHRKWVGKAGAFWGKEVGWVSEMGVLELFAWGKGFFDVITR